MTHCPKGVKCTECTAEDYLAIPKKDKWLCPKCDFSHQSLIQMKKHIAKEHRGEELL
jgi:DNA-directed RNA polymerase subunit RPC12/RpoP